MERPTFTYTLIIVLVRITGYELNEEIIPFLLSGWGFGLFKRLFKRT